jgi:Kef-type K+ transport system membrane component KefB
MDYFLPFFLVLFASVFSSIFFRRIHLPWVVALIVGGMVIGPQALNLFQNNPVTEFMGQVGLIFLMFMAGLDTDLSGARGYLKKFSWLAFINGAVPFLAGFSIGYFFDYDLIASLLLGIIFTSSSVAVVIPSLEASGIIKTRIGQSVVITTVLQDIASLVMLSILLQTVDPVTKLPLPIFYALLLVTLLVMRWLLPKIRWFFSKAISGSAEIFQQEVRSVFLILVGTVVLFEIIGLHPIVAGFFAGLVLAGSVKSELLKEKLYTIGYGVFIPAFFIVIGSQTDLGAFSHASGALLLISIIVIGSVLSKFFSGYLGGRIVGFKPNEASFFGITSIPQLSTTLAVAFTALSLGLIDQVLVTALVILSVVTSTLSPVLIAFFQKRLVSPDTL